MYSMAKGAAEGCSTVWDLYCGAGALGLTAASEYGDIRLYGADSIETSITLARKLADKNGLSATFDVVDLSKHSPPEQWPAPDLIYVNPPRRGLDRPVKDVIRQFLPGKAVYMSCSPVSFASDAAKICAYGYRLESVYGFDMLPNTHHTELLAFFTKLS